MGSASSRSTAEKLALFRACFCGVTHVYGTYDPRTGRSWQVKRPVTERVLWDHLTGRRPYGVYLLVHERIGALAVDFDTEDLGPPMDFVEAALHYGIHAYVERSKAKGYHAWIFFGAEGVIARQARLVARHLLAEIDKPHTEIFPKQDRLATTGFYGNFINAPLFGRLVPMARTVFLNPKCGWAPFADQWGLLATIQRVPATRLAEIIEVNDLEAASPETPDLASPARMPIRTFGLPPCAQRMLAQGVINYQRVACFRLALHLRKSGLPFDLAVAALKAWAVKNHPEAGKDILTAAEIISQTRFAYDRNYRGCGCDTSAVQPYCEAPCPLRGDAC